MSAMPQDVSFESQYSDSAFLAVQVRVKASSFSPVIPKDTCRSSIPLCYLTTTIDEQYNNAITWDLYKGVVAVNSTSTDNATAHSDDLYSWIYQRKVHTSAMGAANFSFKSGYATSVRFGYVNRWDLTDDVDPAFRGFGSRGLVFAFAHSFDSLTNAWSGTPSGSIQDPVVRYIHRGGLAALSPWWKKCYGKLHEIIHFRWDDFDGARALRNAFEATLKAGVNGFYEGVEAPVRSGIAVPFVSEPESYYAIVALSARQVMRAYVYAEPQEVPCESAGGPLASQKEIPSIGNTNTVDVLYPASPFFLYADPALLRRALLPLYEF
ncbi:hypothetical protein DL764_007815 [Monosporascus ibericus]|uniref:Uncharacterized protein n=1 Tax=Monosporascus ibericus TaxID=155417 RepID=A0A4V1X9F6_9PEZI|nr:hypothetical protein DL764_007815 [Monosporascus ibericus]